MSSVRFAGAALGFVVLVAIGGGCSTAGQLPAPPTVGPQSSWTRSGHAGPGRECANDPFGARRLR